MKNTNSIFQGTQCLAETLETLLDKSSVQEVCEALRQVCNAKAEHVQVNWQDEPLANLWESIGDQFDNIAHNAFLTGQPSFKSFRS